MSRPTSQAPKRSDRTALMAGAVASAVVHGVLFAAVAFDAPSPALDDRAAPATAFADDALRLIVLEETHRPPADPDPTDSRVEAEGEATSSDRPAPGAPSNAAGSVTSAEALASSPPPVLLTYAVPVRSPLLVAASADAGSARAEAEDDAAETTADEAIAPARAATYAPGGVRSAKLGWSGQDAAMAKRDGRIRLTLAAGIGDGHCPARPPARGPLGL